MNFYLLDNLHTQGYDICCSKLIRASNEAEARKIANTSFVGDEGCIWEDPKSVSCEIVDPNGPPEEIMADYKAG